MRSLIPIVLTFSMFGCANQTKVEPKMDNEIAAVQKKLDIALTQQDKLSQQVGRIGTQNTGLMSGGAIYAVATAALFLLAGLGVVSIYIHSRSLKKTRSQLLRS